MKNIVRRKLVYITLVLALILMPVTTVFGQAAAQPLPDALQAGADRLAAVQNEDGGWDWPGPDGDPSNASPKNTVGPIAMGLAMAYDETGDAAHLAALFNAGGLLLAKTNNFSTTDGYLAAKLDEIFGGTTYVDHITANFYTPLANGLYDRNGEGTLYDSAGYINRIRTVREEQGYANLAAWDIGMGLTGAASCGANTAEWIAGVKAEIDELDGGGEEYYDVLGLAGAVYGLAFVGEDYDPTAGEHIAASNLVDLANILAGYQLSTGGFTWTATVMVPNSDEAIQETAYAVLALNEVDAADYFDTIRAAAIYARSVQLVNGGWEGSTGSGENTEITGEALWALSVEPVTIPTVVYESSTVPENEAKLTTGPTQVTVEFSEEMKVGIIEGSAEDTSNYLLVEAGANEIFDTASCAVPGSGAAGPDDTLVIIDIATYSPDTDVVTLGINGGTELPIGDYRLFVCGSTSVESIADVKLNDGQSDSTLDFSVIPVAPTLTAPVDTSSTTDRTPDFEWEDVTGANGYVIQFSTENTFASPTEESVATSTFTPSSEMTYGIWYWRVMTVENGKESDWSNVWSLEIESLAPVLTSPADGSTIANSTPEFDWEDVADVTGYVIQFSLEITFTSPTEESVTVSTFTPSSEMAYGFWYWRVKTVESGADSDWSSVWSVEIEPAAPTLVLPANSSTTIDTTPEFDWEDVHAATGYVLQYSQDETFGTLRQSTMTDSTYTPALELPAGEWFWRVKAQSSTNESAWSEVWSFTAETEILAAPTLVAPADASSTYDTTPTFNWLDVAEATAYILEYSQDASFNSHYSKLVTTSTLTPVIEMGLGEWFWRVKAINATLQSDYSAEWSYTIEEEPLAAPTLLSPTDACSIYDPTPTFDWADIADATSYVLQYDTDADFSNPVEETLTTSTFTPTTDMTPGEWFWRVKSVGAHPESAWSCGSLTILELGIPTLTSPEDGEDIYAHLLSFDWEDVVDATSYQIELSTDDVFSSPTSVEVASSEYTPASALSDGAWYWRVQSLSDSGCISEWSEVRSFTISEAPMETPTLTSPSDDSTTMDTTPTFEWEAIADATDYVLQYDTDSAFNSPSEEILAGTTFTPATEMIENEWFWRVKATGPKPDSEWSSEWSFTIFDPFWTHEYGNNSGWINPDTPREVGDVNGDGFADVVGFNLDGVYVALGDGSEFAPSEQWINQFGSYAAAGGWNGSNTIRTVADVNGDGMADVVGFGEYGVIVSLSTGTNFAEQVYWIYSYGSHPAAGGWSPVDHHRVVADVNGDGMADIVGFGSNGVQVSVSTGSSFAPAEYWIMGYGSVVGEWDGVQNPRTIADLNGDGCGDVVGFSNWGVLVSLSTACEATPSNSFGPETYWGFGYAYELGDWDSTKHIRTFSDVDGDGDDDLVGFGDWGIVVSTSDGVGQLSDASYWAYGYAYQHGGWDVYQHPRTIFDVNNDGMGDVVGFAADGVLVELSDGTKFE